MGYEKAEIVAGWACIIVNWAFIVKNEITLLGFRG
jgi:hypothetical protein